MALFRTREPGEGICQAWFCSAEVDMVRFFKNWVEELDSWRSVEDMAR